MDRDSNTGGGANTRPHWRQRDPSATVVYVVHPAQFRSVVHQLTGAPPAGTQQHSAAPAPAPASAGAAAKAAQQRRGDDDSSSSSNNGRTLGQMHRECLAWAASDDDK